MLTNPPEKKGFHFAATLEHAAAYIEAETIAEAEAIYHKIKQPIASEPQESAAGGMVTEPVKEGSPAPAAATASPAQSTGPVNEKVGSVN